MTALITGPLLTVLLVALAGVVIRLAVDILNPRTTTRKEPLQ